MKKCTLLSLLCVFVTHISLAKAGMPCDNTHVLKNKHFLLLTKPTKQLSSFSSSFSSQHFSVLPSALALTSTMISKEEFEPNNTVAAANPLGGNDVKLKGYITPNSDVDVFSFNATEGDKVYVATQTSSSLAANSTSLEIIRINGTTVLEADDSDGTFGISSSSIAGTVIPTTGTYYIRVRHISNNNSILPYFLYFRLQSGTPTAEAEPNNTLAAANTLPNSGWVGGNIINGQDVDSYAISLNAGDTIYLGLDLDPERDNLSWNGQISLADFDGSYPTANDPNTTSPNSESFFLTVRTSGTYYIVVSSGDGSSGTYQLSASVLPANTANITTYTNTTPVSLPDGPGTTTSTINIPASKRIESLKFSMNFVHGNIGDLEVRLTSPSGNTVILFKDLYEGYPNIFPMPVTIKLDDNAALPLGSFPVFNNIVYQPLKEYRLDWFKGQISQGVWTLSIDDDSPGSSGTLNSWSLEVQEQLPITGTITNIYINDFETSDGGFTHSGLQDEWERGTPSFSPVTTANSGTRCWKTDLDNTYNFNSNTDLVSPNIYIPETDTSAVYLTWAQKFQFSSDDNAYVELQEVGTTNTKRIWQWFGASMIDNFYGSPNYTVHQSAGWGVNRVNIKDFVGKTIRIVFHFNSDASPPNLAGWAIDDVAIFKAACPTSQALSSNYNGVYSRFVASSAITATNQVTTDIGLESPANILYQGGNSVTLLPNFKADASGGTVFMAQIAGCN